MEVFVLLLIMLTLVAVQSLIYKKFSFKKLDYRCDFNVDEAFEGDEIILTETVENRKWLPLPWFKSELTIPKWLVFADAQSVVTYRTRFVPSFFLIRGHKRVTRRWKVTCARRGVFKIETIALVSTDLFGSRTVSKSIPSNCQITVLPASFPLAEIFVRSNRLTGDFPVRFQLVYDPFLVSGVREYLPSDPMKQIHWNSTAKIGHIMVRNQDFSVCRSVMILLNLQSREYEYDQREPVDPDGVENCIRTAASVLEEAFKNSVPVGLAVNQKREKSNEVVKLYKAGLGREHVLNLLRILAALPEGGAPDFSKWLEQLVVDPEITDMILITTYVSKEIFRFCRKKKEEGKSVRILLLRAEGAEIPEDCDVYVIREELVKM